MNREREQPRAGSGARIMAEPAGHRAMASALQLRASLIEGDFLALTRVPYSENDPRNRPALYRHAIAALEARGAQAFEPDRAKARWMRELAVAGTDAAFDATALAAISTACETLARVHMGQWHIPFETLPPRDRDAWRETMDALRQHGRGGSSLTSRSISEDARRAHDLHQVIRRDLAFRRSPGGGWTVEFDPPLKTADLPLPRLCAV